MSDSMWPHRWQPTRLCCSWDSPGKKTGEGCHFFLQCMKVKSESEIAQLCPTLSDPMDCSAPGSFIHGIFQTRVLEWGAIAFSDLIDRWWNIHIRVLYPNVKTFCYSYCSLSLSSVYLNTKLCVSFKVTLCFTKMTLQKFLQT